MAKIFISYRRDDSIDNAGRLSDQLRIHFGAKHRIFRDIDDIKPGEDFTETIESTVASCQVLIAVIGTKWLTAVDDAGRTRLQDPEDLVCREIRTALVRKIRVIPALVGGARMPNRQDLPAALAPLAGLQAVEISDVYYQHSVHLLIEALEQACREAAEALKKQGSKPDTPLAQVQGRSWLALRSRSAVSSQCLQSLWVWRLGLGTAGGVLSLCHSRHCQQATPESIRKMD